MTVVTLPLVGQPGAPVDVRLGGDVDPATGRLLSVAELQLALRAVRSGRFAAPAPTAAGLAVSLPIPAAAEAPAPPWASGRLIAVVAAHGGAGASTTALAIATAAAAIGRTVQLIEWCAPRCSGLVAAATSELGTVDDGSWRRGGRGTSTVIDRREEPDATNWPTPPDSACLRLADLGPSGAVGSLPAVLVCRTSVPGVRRAELALSRLHSPVALAAVGPDRWPGPVAASAGKQVRRLREQGLVVAVPLNRRLDVEGLTGDPLPKQVTEAGARLLALVDAAVGNSPTLSRPAPRTIRREHRDAR